MASECAEALNSRNVWRLRVKGGSSAGRLPDAGTKFDEDFQNSEDSICISC